MAKHLFMPKSVSGEHPDKIVGQIFDAVLDAILEQNPGARIACGTYAKTGMILVGGEITASARVDIEEVTRNMAREIGHVYSDMDFGTDSCAVLSTIGKQSPDISQGVDRADPLEQGTSDQGLVLGHVTGETDVLIPAPVIYAHRLAQRQAEVRKNDTLPQLRLDARNQVASQYDDDKIVDIDAVVLSVQRSEDVDQKSLQEAIMEEIIKPVLPTEWLTTSTKFFINPTGHLAVGGPMDDCDLTGCEIVVDTYGDMARRGDGAFSGKDLSKADCSTAYTVHYIARNVVATDLADRYEVQVSYTVGVVGPTSIMTETSDIKRVPSGQLTLLVCGFSDSRPYGLIRMLDLLHPVYRETTTYGHLGRKHPPWEKADKTQLLHDTAGLK